MDRMPGLLARAVACLLLAPFAAGAAEPGTWALKPVARPDMPSGSAAANPIDLFLAADHRAKGLTPAGPADKRTILRRVTFDLTGLPPTIEEQEAFLRDESPDAYQKVVDRLLASEQHGVRYGRHWLDVLRYADMDERMVAAPGIHLWREWVIRAINDDVPYDQFVRAQLTGYRTAERTQMSATGFRSRKEPRPDDLFALGLLARGAVFRDGKGDGELAMAAVETVSSAFMGMTVACAKCHDHMYDPIKQRDYYSMKALFDPLVVRKVTLATPAEMVAAGKAADEADRRRAAIQGPIDELVAPYRKRLHDERVAMLPPDVRAIILKPDRERSAAERKVADDYFPVLRIDTDKILEIMPEADRKRYRALQAKLDSGGGDPGRRGPSLPAFWTVEADPVRAAQPSYILTSGDPDRPEKKHPVEPGWPFGPEKPDLSEGRVEAFSDWLTAPENPLLARVAVNRLWQWHFGEGLQKTPSDFGKLGGTPADPALLDWLASEFAARGFRMKAIHRLIVTSDAYRRASEPPAEFAGSNNAADPANAYLWRFPLRRLEAEPIWDAIWAAAGGLDPAVGGPSFDPAGGRGGMGGGRRGGPAASPGTSRRAAFMVRGYSTSRDVVPVFLQAFDVDDGRVPCPVRTRTITPPQALFLMNGEAIERATERFAKRIEDESGGDLAAAVDLAYRLAVARPPSPTERERSLAYLDRDPARLKGLAWLLLNLDEFLFVR
ncbi:hypothetical protein OJF2_46500 [Aquisphaera giovannonii]|uniref:Planctomycete cytochrome C n=1 Tax=Aquisphaera giovannonii TaxID=406548 RepID=A0A5B9W845_9BACT|nr:DUF1549 and DUF1553 domain-containing protein [Aquisphaera giovannonii]QEH36090.1 hypothetical protein OJF2_46500 [Aquisphaera giovannonii]